VIGADVELGESCHLVSHVAIEGPTKIGADNSFFPFSAIGMAPQDVTYKGEPTRLEIGDHNEIREYVTINRGTVKGGGLTKVGSHLLIMAYTHIGHDCVIGDHAMLVNGATLGGHVIVEEWAVPGPPICPDRGAFLRWRGHDDHAGCFAVLDDFCGARNACLPHEQSRTAAARILQRTDCEDPSRLQSAVGFKDEYLAGPRKTKI
jgi:hypothetical protein